MQEIKTIKFIRTAQEVVENGLNNASVEWSINPFFSEGGYFYKVEGEIMFVINSEHVAPDGRLHIYKIY